MKFGLARQPGVRDAYSFVVSETAPMILDAKPAIRELLADLGRKDASGRVSAKFHNMLLEIIVAIARKVRVEKIVLTGGCFQNRYLSEHTVEQLRQENFKPYWHQRVPPNDGGIALGHAVAAIWDA
jgi:hydrogenase maturation protein HypF